MTTRPFSLLPLSILLACSALFATGCNRAPPPPADAGAVPADDGFIARMTRDGLERARKDIASGNINVGGRGSGAMNINGVTIGGRNGRTSHLPKAEISPAGDLLVDGTQVAVDAEQRALLLAHRANIVAIADAGITIGIQGAQLGLRAARGALTSALTGTSEEFEKRMEAEGEKMGVEAQKLCELMPALLDSQQALAAALPAFAPYATLEASDIDNCRKDSAHRDDAAAEADAAAETAAD